MKDIEKQKIIDLYLEGKTPVLKIREEFGLSRKIFEKFIQTNLTPEQIKKRRSKKVITAPPKHINLIGKKFSFLTIVDLKKTDKSTDGSYRSICICDCGREKDVNTNYLMRLLVKSCGNSECPFHRQDSNNNGKKNVKFKGYEEISGVKWNQIKHGARTRNLEFNITLEYIWELFLKQERKCALTGVDIFFGRTNTKETTASLDRIDSSKGYVKGNVHWVHKTVNIIKMDLKLEEFINWCKLVVNNFEIL